MEPIVSAGLPSAAASAAPTSTGNPSAESARPSTARSPSTTSSRARGPVWLRRTSRSPAGPTPAERAWPGAAAARTGAGVEPLRQRGGGDEVRGGARPAPTRGRSGPRPGAGGGGGAAVARPERGQPLGLDPGEGLRRAHGTRAPRACPGSAPAPGLQPEGALVGEREDRRRLARRRDERPGGGRDRRAPRPRPGRRAPSAGRSPPRRCRGRRRRGRGRRPRRRHRRREARRGAGERGDRLERVEDAVGALGVDERHEVEAAAGERGGDGGGGDGRPGGGGEVARPRHRRGAASRRTSGRRSR